jgi:hypothetical protein
MAMLHARVSRLWRWEFWPAWAFYPPGLLGIAWLAVRHGGVGTLTSANPGFPDGGFVGESKVDILQRLPQRWVPETFVVEAGTLAERLHRVDAAMSRLGLTYPVIFKPDVGQRGFGVRRVHSADDARSYLAQAPGRTLVQRLNPGPFEAGVFYYRFPGEVRGRIFSITDKHFPVIVGDGVRTLEELIWAHRRYRMQGRLFAARHHARRNLVLADGERYPIGVIGDHSQGTCFQDGSHLITPALEERIDQIARSVPGFFVGRFDIRYADVDRFKAGQDLCIVELNGVTSESTNLYDPRHSLGQAYRILYRQWRLIFAIGAINRRLGHAPSPMRRLMTLSIAHLTSRLPLPLAD